MQEILNHNLENTPKNNLFSKLVFGWFFISLFYSCKDYHNDAIDWMSKIPKGSTIEEVKKQKPHFIEINWNEPDSNSFIISKIEGNNDILNMSYFLNFSNGRYTGWQAHK